MFEILIVGLGPAGAAAARLLNALGRDVVAVGTEPELPWDPRIILPPAATEALRFLGVLQQVQAIGEEVERVTVRGDGRSTETRAGGTAVSEGAMASCIRAELSTEQMVEGRIAGLIVEDGRVCGARLGDGRELRAGLTLCTVGALLPNEARPLTAGPVDSALSALLDVPIERFGMDQHRLHTTARGWGWALRLDEAKVQYTWFCEQDGDAPSAEGTPLFDAMADSHWLRRKVTPCLPDAPTMPGLVPLGRAAYVLHPMSSLGTAQALDTARLAAAAANTCFQSDRAESAVLAWLRDQYLDRAVRAHALTSMAFADAGFVDAPYWRKRADSSWTTDAVSTTRRLVAMRAVELQQLHREQRFFDTKLRRVRGTESGNELVLRGPMVKERAVVRPPVGLSIPVEEFPPYAALIDEFDSPATVEQVLARRRARLPPGRNIDEAEKSLARAIGRLYEDGFLLRA